MRTTKTKTFSLPPDVAEELEAKANGLRVPESTLVTWALERFLRLRAVTLETKPTKRRRTGAPS